jgi:hypothetical protein
LLCHDTAGASWWHLAAFVSAVILSELSIGSIKSVYDRTRRPGSLLRPEDLNRCAYDPSLEDSLQALCPPGLGLLRHHPGDREAARHWWGKASSVQHDERHLDLGPMTDLRRWVQSTTNPPDERGIGHGLVQPDREGGRGAVGHAPDPGSPHSCSRSRPGTRGVEAPDGDDLVGAARPPARHLAPSLEDSLQAAVRHVWAKTD